MIDLNSGEVKHEKILYKNFAYLEGWQEQFEQQEKYENEKLY